MIKEHPSIYLHENAPEVLHSDYIIEKKECELERGKDMGIDSI